MNDTIEINEGEVFVGSRAQFEDCFFSEASDAHIVNWAINGGFYSVKINGISQVMIGHDINQ